MMSLKHPFSPITDEARFQAALTYIASQSGPLAKAVLGNELAIDTVCFFAHSQTEYNFLFQTIGARGPLSEFTHGLTTYINVDFAVATQHLKILGVRAPDATRPQVGYADFPVANYAQLLKATADNPYLTEIKSGRGQSLIELRHPDFDILGYAFDQTEH